MTKLFLVFGVLGFVAVLTAKAQENNSNRRYLLIVETSKSMDRRLTGLNQTIEQLLSSGLRGELRRDDTIGVWTYNTDLFTGKFPLQHFSPETQKKLTADVVGFIKHQKYEGNPDWARLVPALRHVVEDSPTLTIILVTAATESIQGTPFDTNINQSITSWRDQQQAARMPVVTVLRTHLGKITGWAVTAPPWPVELPALPKQTAAPRQVVTKAPAKTNAPVAKPAAPMAQPLIVIGKKPASSIPATVSAPATSALPAHVAIQATVVTNVETGVTLASQPASPSASTASALAPVVAASVAVPAQSGDQQPSAAAKVGSAGASSTSEVSVTTTRPAGVVDPGERSQAATNSIENAAPGQVAAAAPVATVSRHLPLLPIAALGLLTACLIVAVLFWRRSHQPEQISLITRSFERHQAQLISDPVTPSEPHSDA